MKRGTKEVACSGRAGVNAQCRGLRGFIDRHDVINQTRAMFREGMLVLVFVQVGNTDCQHIQGPPDGIQRCCRRGRPGHRQALVCDRVNLNNGAVRGLRSCVYEANILRAGWLLF